MREAAHAQAEATKRESDARLITAEHNRQREIQRRVQAIRQHVISAVFTRRRFLESEILTKRFFQYFLLLPFFNSSLIDSPVYIYLVYIS